MICEPGTAPQRAKIFTERTMKLATRAFVLSLALAFVGATAAVACPGADAAKATNAGHAGCGAKATATANAAHPGCGAKAATSGCCAKGAGQVAEKTGSRVSLEGTVLCAHCDLKMADACSTMLKTADGRMVKLMTSDKVMTLREQAGHGAKVVRVKGVVGQDGDVTVNSFKVLADAPAATAAGV